MTDAWVGVVGTAIGAALGFLGSWLAIHLQRKADRERQALEHRREDERLFGQEYAAWLSTMARAQFKLQLEAAKPREARSSSAELERQMREVAESGELLGYRLLLLERDAECRSRILNTLTQLGEFMVALTHSPDEAAIEAASDEYHRSIAETVEFVRKRIQLTDTK